MEPSTTLLFFDDQSLKQIRRLATLLRQIIHITDTSLSIKIPLMILLQEILTTMFIERDCNVIYLQDN